MKQVASIFVALLLMLTVVSVAFAQDANGTASTTADANASVSATETQTTAAEANASVETATTTENTSVETVATSEPTTEETTAQPKEAEQPEVETTSEEPSNETKDVEVMTDHPGVVVRVTELQERIERAVVNGETIIAQLSAQGKTVTDLQSIVDSLKSLKDQAGQIDTNQDVSASTAQFVSIKKQAIDLVKQFRDKVRALVPPGQRDELKKKAKEAEASALKALRDKVKQVRQAHNREAFENVLQRLGVALPEIEAKLANGTISVADARKAIRDAFQGLPSDKKANARQKLQEGNSELRVKKLATLQRLKGKVEGRVQTNRTKTPQRKNTNTGESNE